MVLFSRTSWHNELNTSKLIEVSLFKITGKVMSPSAGFGYGLETLIFAVFIALHSLLFVIISSLELLILSTSTQTILFKSPLLASVLALKWYVKNNVLGLRIPL